MDMPPEPWREHYAHPGLWDRDFAPLSLPAMFEAAAAAHGPRPLVEFMGRRFSYAQLLAQARGFAAGLQALGLARGDRVGLFLPNVPAYVAAYYGALIAGLVVVNFSPLYAEGELAAQAHDSGTRLLVTLDSPALLPKALSLLQGTPVERLVVVRLGEQLPTLKRIALALVGRKQTMALPRRPDVLDWGAVTRGPAPTPVSIDPLADLALIQYTGGTTGVPKGALLTHQNLSANARQINAAEPYSQPADVALAVLPLFHVFANSCLLNRTVVAGCSLSMLPRFDAGQVIATVARVRPTALFVVPTMLQALLAHPKMPGSDWRCVREIISGAAPLPSAVRERFEGMTGTRVIEGYGLTESAGVVTVNPLTPGREAHGIGQPLPATRLRLLDRDDPALDAAPGEPGELAVLGPQVMQGYWNRPDAAAISFAMRGDQRWLRTGDVATIDAHGYASIVDRQKDMIAVGGFKVYPSQVEAVLLDHPAVAEAVVMGMPDAYHGEVPRAFVILREPGAGVTGDALRDWLNARVGKHERVDAVVIRASLPKTMIGKLDRKALRAELADAVGG